MVNRDLCEVYYASGNMLNHLDRELGTFSCATHLWCTVNDAFPSPVTGMGPYGAHHASINRKSTD